MSSLPAGFSVEVNLEGVDSDTMILGHPDLGRFGTGLFGGAPEFVDVTPFVREGSIHRGTSRHDGVYARAEAGTCELLLDNRDARFDSTNEDSPYWNLGEGRSQIQPMVAVRVSAEGIPLWRGFADSWELAYPLGGNDAVCVLRATDGTKVLGNFDGPEQGSQGTGETTGARIRRILDSAGWSGELRDIDDGETTVQATTLAQPAWTEILLTADTEIGEVYFASDGSFRFRGRHGLLSEERSVDPQVVFGDGPGELGYVGLELVHDDLQIRNLIRISRAGGSAHSAEDLLSQARYLRRTYTRFDLIHQTEAASQDYADYLLSVFRDGELRFEGLELAPRGDPAALYPQALGRELGDRIRVRLRPPGREDEPIERDAYIRGVEHSFGPDRWRTRWALQDATRWTFLVLDHATLGRLDENKLAY